MSISIMGLLYIPLLSAQEDRELAEDGPVAATITIRTRDASSFEVPSDVLAKSKTLLDLLNNFSEDPSESEVLDISEIKNKEVMEHVAQLCQLYDKYAASDDMAQWKKYIAAYFNQLRAYTSVLLADIIAAANYLAIRPLIDGFDDAAFEYFRHSLSNKPLEALLQESNHNNNVSLSLQLGNSGVRNRILIEVNENIVSEGSKDLEVGTTISSFCISPDGKRVAIGFSNGDLRVWDMQQQWRSIDAPKSHLQSLTRAFSTPAPVTDLAFSYDGTKVVYICDGVLGLWDIAAKSYIRVDDTRGPVGFIKMSPDRENFAVTTLRGFLVFDIWGRLEGINRNMITSFLAYLSKGKIIITAWNRKDKIECWEVKTADYFKKLVDHDMGNITGLVCAPNETMFASTSEDKAIRVWDGTDFTRIGLFDVKEPVRNPVYSSDSSQILAIVSDNEIQQWDFIRKMKVQSFKNGPETIYDVQWIPGSKCIVSVQQGKISFWDTDSGSLVKTWQTVVANNPRISIDNKGHFIAFLKNEKILRVYDLQGLKRHGKHLNALYDDLQDLSLEQLLVVMALVDAQEQRAKVEASKRTPDVKRVYESLPIAVKEHFKRFVQEK